MAKRKHSADWMLARVREYLSGKGSYRQIARANGISERGLRDWVRKYEEQGEASFTERAGNASYSKEFKVSCVLFTICEAIPPLVSSSRAQPRDLCCCGFHYSLCYAPCMRHRIPHSWSIRLPVSVHTHTLFYRKRKRFLANARNDTRGRGDSHCLSHLQKCRAN